MAESPARLDGASLLVVGDEPWQASFVETLDARTKASVRTESSGRDALETAERERIDCLISAADIGEFGASELVVALRESGRGVPTVLATSSGSESLAGEAIAAGVAGYVPMTEPLEDSIETLVSRTADVIGAERACTGHRDRARQFDAVFQDPQTATWVLDPDGTLARANDRARAMLDADLEGIEGEPFWETPWWDGPDGLSADVESLVTAPRDGRAGNAVVRIRSGGDADRVVELSVRPVEDDGDGDLVSIVVEGIDVTDQVDLERELRRSEELHRVTLNNMTDTVLITDEDGEYTYVCPNVHFIFGYTADEIRAQGTIDELLGPDLFDREALERRGVLKNVECTVTDKAGREHTLLVNVREVSIQDGTLLYSCRDVTTRKQREEALATLQETAREFLYAETHQEIAQQVVADAPSVLDLPASAVYLFDVDDNELRPVANSPAMDELHGPLPTIHADGDTLPGHSFVADETLTFEDVHDAERLENRATGLRSAVYIPLGKHGVFVAGSGDVGVLEEVTRELADLLAATAEAALDRVSRESQLREQDRELQRQNDQLAAVNRINETIRAIDRAIVRADSREEIEHTVCERLTDVDRYEFAWIGTLDSSSGTVLARAQAGDGQGYLDGRSIEVASSGVEPAGQTAATGEATVVNNVAADLRDHPWRSDALTRDFLSVLSVPLAFDGLSYGVLTVYADTRDAFGDTARGVLGELGETIASGLSAVERTRALLSTDLTRLEFAVEDETLPLARLARAANCTVTYRGGVQGATEGNRVFVDVDGAPVERVAAVAGDLEGIEDVTVMGETDGGGVLRLRLQRPFHALEFAEHGAILGELTASPGSTRLVVDVPDNVDVRNVTTLVSEVFGGSELVGKRPLEGGGRDRYSTVLSKLTDRQREVLQTAYYGGYFDSPRENTGEDIAAALDISPAAFYQHVRSIQRTLFTTLVEGQIPGSGGSEG